MIVLAGGDIVLPDRILTSASLIIDQGRIAAIDGTRGAPAGASLVNVHDGFVVPGFVDVPHGPKRHFTRSVGDITLERLHRIGTERRSGRDLGQSG